jgi:ABC-type multidrug transport system fused ATPase/permease subunit
LLAILYWSPLLGLLGLAMTAVTVIVIVRFDRVLIPAQHDINEREHSLSANLSDSLSNIVTVITLRLERSMERGLVTQAQRIFGPFRRWSQLNEWKWCTASVDPKTELLIYEKMFRDFHDKAVVSALHRLHLMRLFDVIYVLDRGRVVARGTLDVAPPSSRRSDRRDDRPSPSWPADPEHHTSSGALSGA